jgi:hypothetical protein
VTGVLGEWGVSNRSHGGRGGGECLDVIGSGGECPEVVGEWG